jgi:DNA-binding transcriptional regulator YhcF (GntR family)
LPRRRGRSPYDQQVDDVRYTWADREVPLLRESVRRIDAGEEWPAMREIATTCGIDFRQAEVAFDALEEDGYLVVGGRASGLLNANVAQVTGKARREVGAWPTAEGVIDQLVAALTAAAEAETEPANRSRLREAAETLSSTGYRIAVDVATKWAERKAGF